MCPKTISQDLVLTKPTLITLKTGFQHLTLESRVLKDREVDHLVLIKIVRIWDLELMMLEIIILMEVTQSLIHLVKEKINILKKVHQDLVIIKYLAKLQIYLLILNPLRMNSLNMFELYKNKYISLIFAALILFTL